MTRSEAEVANALADFDRHTVWHQELKSAFDGCIRSIELARGDGRITVVLGASGVGKERLAHELRRHLELTHGRRPTYAEVATGSSTAPVSMGAVYDLFLADLGAIGSHYVLATNRRVPGVPARIGKTQYARLIAIDNLLRLLQVPALILDEAQYLVAQLSRTRQLTNLRAFTFLANRKCAPIVMLGTLDLIDALKSAPDVHRRIRIVRFERFCRAEQMPGFGAALVDYDEYLKQQGLRAAEFALFEERVRLYEACFGCIGNLHNLILEALSDALHAGHLLGSHDFDQAERDLIPDRLAFELETVRLESRLTRLLNRPRPVPALAAGAAPATVNIGSTASAGSKQRPASPKTRSVPIGELKKIRHTIGEGRGMLPRPPVS